MTTISAKQFKKAIAKAKNVGQVEEPVTLNGVSFVLQSLRPDQYEAVFEECSELEDIKYLNAYQMGHISRSLIELEGQDLRGVDFVEVEIQDPKNEERTKLVKLEMHEYLRSEVLSTWGKEAIGTTFRKFLDVVAKAEVAAKEGVTFIIPDENPEDKYRRLVFELKAIESEIPEGLSTLILAESGYMHKTSKEELDAASTRLAQVAKDSPEPAAVQEEPEVLQKAPPKLGTQWLNQAQEAIKPAPVERVQQPEQEVAEVLPTRKAMTKEEVESVMAKRVPLNRMPVVELPNLKNKNAELSALEDLTGLEDQPAMTPIAPTEAAELTKPLERVDVKRGVASLDPLPAGGINPRFKPPINRL